MIQCIFKDFTFLDNKIAYVCEFNNQDIPENVRKIPQGAHQLDYNGDARNNSHVVGVIFSECNITKVPQGLTRIFPNMKIFSIWASNLKIVTKDDLAEYRNIERIGFCKNEIEFLPGDLFEGFTNLEEIAFKGNKLELIEPNILDKLDKLKNINFKNNPAYTKCYSLLSGCQSNATFEEVKDELFLRFYRNHRKIEDLLKLEDENQGLKDTINSLNEDIGNLKNEVQNLNEKCQNLQDENHKINEKFQNYKEDNQSDIKNFLKTDEAFKDFRIQIDDQEFPVHKFLLAARSPILAEILKINSEVENLNLVDISVEIFEIILKFLYTDELPGDNGMNFLHLFAAAGKLRIQELKDFAANKIIDHIDAEKSLDILKLSNKYDHEGLRQSAFDKVKECHPKIEFKDEWAEDIDTLVKIVEAFKMKEEAIKKAEEEFKNLIIRS